MTKPIPTDPEILTTTVGSYPVPDWLVSLPSEQAVVDATRVVFATQREAGIDVVTDGELYRFDVSHPDTNGMIEYFLRPLDGIRNDVGLKDWQAFAEKDTMRFRTQPAAVVTDAIGSGSLNLLRDCRRAASVAPGPLKFTLTSPYMLARTLLDHHYNDFDALVMALADVIAGQVAELPCACLQVDEANVTGSPEHAAIAARGINKILDAFPHEKAVHLCFGNYGGQTIQGGHWEQLVGFLDSLNADHVVLELAHRPKSDLVALKDVRGDLKMGLGVIDVKVNHVETPDEVAESIERIVNSLGDGRLRFVHPDCGFWMLKRSVADRKMKSLVEGRNLFLGARQASLAASAN